MSKLPTAEEFLRDKAFPDGISKSEWDNWKHSHTGVNWPGFSIEALHTYGEKLLDEFRDRMKRHGFRSNPDEHESVTDSIHSQLVNEMKGIKS